MCVLLVTFGTKVLAEHAGLPDDNALYIDASHNPMDQPGGFLVNGTSVSIYAFNLAASVTAVKLLDPLNSLVATAVPHNGQAFIIGASMQREGTWTLAGQLLTAITQFDIEIRAQGEGVTVSNDTATLFPDTLNFTATIEDLFEASGLGVPYPEAGDVTATGGIPPDQTVACDSNDIASIDIGSSLAFVPIQVDLHTSSMGPADTAYAVLYVEEVGGFHRPSGATIVPTVPGENGSKSALARTLVFEGQSYTNLIVGLVLPEAGEDCSDSDEWSAV